MGRSAKVHKRVKNTTSSSTAHPKPVAPEPKAKAKAKQSAEASPSVQSAKKRADLKSKVKGKLTKSVEEGHVLGGADYVTLLLGGRRKADEEALKLAKE